MKLVHPDVEDRILDDNCNFAEWIIENPVTFAAYLQELMEQCNGEDGRFVLSQKEKELDLGKNTELIMDIFHVNCNDKRMINKLYAELDQLAHGELFFVQTQEVVQRLQTYIMDLEQETSYVLRMDEEINLPAVLKSLGVAFEVLEADFFERLIRYLKLVTILLDKKLFVFVNVRSFLSDSQMEMLFQEANYQGLHILCIENCSRDCLQGVKRCIIDRDNCVI